MTDLGAPAGVRSGAAAALMAPAAMAAGALGLLALWTLAPRAPASAPLALRPVMSGAAPPVSRAAELRSQGLSRLLVDLGAPAALTQPPALVLTRTPAEVAGELRAAETSMVSASDRAAQARLQAAKAVFRGAGLNPQPYLATAPATARAPLSPRELRDARVLAARLDVDAPLAAQVQRTARDLLAAEALNDAAGSIPLATPVADPVRSSSFGVRVDPFTHTPAFHPGQDFSGRYGQAIHVTAPGVVSFVGQRSGYGNCIEVDHGHGFKTRYGHLSGFEVGVGTPVKTGDVIGRMGSTGRSTGVHLHYEVWASGRLENPARFLVNPVPGAGG